MASRMGRTNTSALNFGWVVRRIMTVFKNTALIHVLVTGYGHENKTVKKTVLKPTCRQNSHPNLQGGFVLLMYPRWESMNL